MQIVYLYLGLVISKTITNKQQKLQFKTPIRKLIEYFFRNLINSKRFVNTPAQTLRHAHLHAQELISQKCDCQLVEFFSFFFLKLF